MIHERYDIANTNYMALPGLLPGIVMFRSDIDPKSIIKMTSICMDVAVNCMRSKRRLKEYVAARMMAMYLIKKHTSMTLVNIGKIFGGRDHTTAIHGINRASDLVQTDKHFKQKLLSIENKLIP